jgi:hypothetical protein
MMKRFDLEKLLNLKAEKKKQEKTNLASPDKLVDDDSFDGISNGSYKRVERKIVANQLDAAVDDICQRKRFDPKYRSEIKRFVSCLDMDRDENIKRMNFLASKKM